MEPLTLDAVLAQLLILSGVIFGLVEIVKPIYDPAKRDRMGDKIAAAVFGVGLCLAAKIDAFPAIGLPLAVPFLGSALTGLLALSGAAVWHGGIGVLTKIRNGAAPGSVGPVGPKV